MIIDVNKLKYKLKKAIFLPILLEPVEASIPVNVVPMLAPMTQQRAGVKFNKLLAQDSWAILIVTLDDWIKAVIKELKAIMVKLFFFIIILKMLILSSIKTVAESHTILSPIKKRPIPRINVPSVENFFLVLKIRHIPIIIKKKKNLVTSREIMYVEKVVPMFAPMITNNEFLKFMILELTNIITKTEVALEEFKITVSKIPVRRE